MNTQKETQKIPDLLGLGSEETASGVDALANQIDPAVETAADEHVKKLLNFKNDDIDGKDVIKDMVTTMGVNLQRENQTFTPMLEQTIQRVARDSEGGEVAKAMVDLKIQVESLDPAKFDFSAGWASRIAGFIPIIGTPVKRYFTKYESANTVLASIFNSLAKGKEELQRDNTTIAIYQKSMQKLAVRLKHAIEVLRVMDAKIDIKLAGMPEGDEKTFIAEEISFYLKQRIMDLQQSLAVNQQGVLAFNVIINNNKELIKGAERTQEVTRFALNTAVMVALALGNQKIVLDKIEGITTATNNIMKGTAARLKTQGVEIHNRAAGAALDIEALKSAFNDINQAMDDMSKFKRESLAKMNSTIKEMGELNEEAEQKIKDMEKGKKVRDNIIDLDKK